MDLSVDGSGNKVAHFKLPANVQIKNYVSASMEPFVEKHLSMNKQALRNMIKLEMDGPVGKVPVSHMISKIDDKVAIVCD